MLNGATHMSEPTAEKPRARLLSLDAYRGLTLLAMASSGLGIAKMVNADPVSNFWWDQIANQLDHTAWRGCSFWDMIQPTFMFIVGVAMPFSFENRRAQGESWWKMLGHAAFRSLVLVGLGVFLASQGSKHTNFVFTNVLAQVGLGYMFVFLLLGRHPALQGGVACAILVIDWLLFATHPLPEHGFPWISVGIYPGWPRLHGFLEHWEKNVNFASHFDQWFLNLFPQPDGVPFKFNPGGYTTLNFVPSISTMIFGVMAGQWLRSHRSASEKMATLLILGAVGIVLGTALDNNICPVVKRIWTPSWVIYSTGWTVWQLAAFYWVIDVRGFHRWALPLVVVGVNSIAMYMMWQLSHGWVRSILKTHIGQNIFDGPNGPIIESVSVLFVWWLVCFWMYKRRIFLRI